MHIISISFLIMAIRRRIIRRSKNRNDCNGSKKGKLLKGRELYTSCADDDDEADIIKGMIKLSVSL